MACWADTTHSLHQRHFPTGAVVNTIENVGAVKSLAYRETDGAVAACVRRWGGDLWLLWGRFGCDIWWERLEAEGNALSFGGERSFVMASASSISLFGESQAGIVETARMDGKPWERVYGLAWNGPHVVYGLANGDVCLWDTRAQKGTTAFSTNPQMMSVSRIVVKQGDLYVGVNFADRRALTAWDIRMAHEPVRVFDVPRPGGRYSFDVSERGGVLAAGNFDDVWLWDCWRGGRVLGGWNFETESLKRVFMVGWGGRREGVFAETDCDAYYVPLGGWTY